MYDIRLIALVVMLFVLAFTDGRLTDGQMFSRKYQLIPAKISSVGLGALI